MRACAASIVVLALLGGHSETAAAGVGNVAPAGKVRVWTPQFMGGTSSRTSDQALRDARFPVLVAHEGTYRLHVPAMKGVNPALRVFVYMNATATWEKNLPESAYAHDELGNRITIKGWPFTRLLDPSSPQAIAYQPRRAVGLLAASGYDGLYLDSLGPASLHPGYVSGLPVNPATRDVWTRSAWLEATTSLASQVKAAVAPRPTIGNGLSSGPAYFDASAPTSGILDAGLNGGVSESWLRSAGQSLARYPSENVWRQNVDMLARAGARGASIMTMTKLWTRGTLSRKRSWHRFALASYLLGNTGRAYFGFSFRKGDSTVLHGLSRLNLGRALGRYRRVGSVYRRSFRRGKVFVNPTGSTYRIRLKRAHRTLGGARVRSVTLRPHTAVILKRV